MFLGSIIANLIIKFNPLDLYKEPKYPILSFFLFMLYLKFSLIDEPLGKNDGSVKGTRYFQCANRYGGFCRASNLQVGDFPEADLFADLSDSDEDEI